MGNAAGPMPISQIAIVVKDIHAAMEAYHSALGWGPWNVYEHKPPTLHDTELHGAPQAYSMIGAETHVGPIVVELLQPVDGPSIYKEWLETKGEGLHHIACMAPSHEESDAIKARFAAMGAKVTMGGRIGETIEYYYLDTEPLLKVIIESGSGHAVDLTPAYTYPSDSAPEGDLDPVP
ncbi:MAG: VOC family protein [Chloroflexia bacterium]|nr:VOC family protein [Chloroflexia bacterium]